MQNFGLCLFVLILFTGLCADCATKKSEVIVHSTQGLEDSNEQVLELSKPSKADKNEQKESKNRSNEYIKLKKKRIKQDSKRLHKEKELEYLEYRLELKKQKLESLGSDYVKGEEEWRNY